MVKSTHRENKTTHTTYLHQYTIPTDSPPLAYLFQVDAKCLYNCDYWHFFPFPSPPWLNNVKFQFLILGSERVCCLQLCLLSHHSEPREVSTPTRHRAPALLTAFSLVCVYHQVSLREKKFIWTQSVLFFCKARLKYNHFKISRALSEKGHL